ncbi:MAG: hypothetical protein GY796_25590 [Chloroflexi bacterium]|nr:hypothetical protein [Chloroflexota bacterium]
MNESLYHEPVSINNPAFISLIDTHLAKGEVVIALVRYANRGGGGDKFLLHSKKEFSDLVGGLNPKTSLSIFFESAFPLIGKADTSMMNRAIELFQEEYEEYEGINIIKLNRVDSTESDQFTFLSTEKKIRAWFQKQSGADVLIGIMNFWQDNNEHIVTVYVPDIDGIVRPGAY